MLHKKIIMARVHFTARIDEIVYTKVIDIGKNENRTLTNTVETLLKEAVEAREKKK